MFIEYEIKLQVIKNIESLITYRGFIAIKETLECLYIFTSYWFLKKVFFVFIRFLRMGSKVIELKLSNPIQKQQGKSWELKVGSHKKVNNAIEWIFFMFFLFFLLFHLHTITLFLILLSSHFLRHCAVWYFCLE